MGRCEAAGAKKPEAYSLEYVEDCFGPRTTQMPADHLPQQNGITQTGSEAEVGTCCGGVCTASEICGLAV